MEERLAEEQARELRASDIVSEWLGESRYLARLIADIDDALAIMAGKRTTLEEKIIAKELHALLSQFGRILSILHLKLSALTAPDEKLLERLRSLNYEVNSCVQVLLRALRYNLSFVEQYFEFDFCSKLTQQCCFPAQAEELAKLLDS